LTPDALTVHAHRVFGTPIGLSARKRPKMALFSKMAFVGDWFQTLTACVAHHDNSERLEAHKHREQSRSSVLEKCAPCSDKPSESVNSPPPSGPADEILAAVSAALSRLPSSAKESTQAGPGHTEKARALLHVSKRTKLCEMTVNPLLAHVLMRVL
jgi:hypothetical protein